MIAFLPAFLLLLMQGALPPDALEPRLGAELWLQIQANARFEIQESCDSAEAVVRASQAPGNRAPAKPLAVRAIAAPVSPLPSAPLLTGDRSRDGPLG